MKYPSGDADISTLAINKLSAKSVRSAAPGKYADGAGLWFVKRPDGGAQGVISDATMSRLLERRGMDARPMASAPACVHGLPRKRTRLTRWLRCASVIW